MKPTDDDAGPETGGVATARPEDEILPVTSTFAYGFQHVLSMYGGIIAVPLIVGQAADLSAGDIGILIAAALFVGGLATLLQTLGVPLLGCRLPLVQGVSFSGVATMVAIVSDGGGLSAVYGAIIVAAAVGLLIAPVFAKIVRFFPPVVTGSVITTIGLSLMPVAANWAMGGNKTAPDYGSVSNLTLAAVTLALVLVLSKVGIAAISRLSILLAIVLGTLVAVAVGKTDFSKVDDGAIVAFPTPFHLGAPTFDVAAIVGMLIVMLVILTETMADILAVGEIIGTKTDSRRIAAGLRADMASSLVAPVFGSFPQSAFAQNVGLVAVTRVKSRYVVAAGGLILVLLGLLPVLGRVVAAVPTAVLGGAGIVLFGTVAASGIRTLAKVEYRDNMNLIIVATSIGFGMIPIAAPAFYEHTPSWFGTIFHSGISSAAVMAIALNLLFNHLRPGSSRAEQPATAVTGRVVSARDLECLVEGDRYEGGRLIDRDGIEVARAPEGLSGH
jgi:NCS2 family nucleobase:cation symporter-2